MGCRWIVGAGFVLVALACGGGGLGGSPVGPFATSMAEHVVSENPGVPCLTYNVGEEFSIGDFTYRVDEVTLRPPENALPWIRNHEERSAFSADGVQALVVVYSVRNDTPVAKERDAFFSVIGTSGEELPWGPYNAELIQREMGLEGASFGFVSGSLAPGRWYTGVSVHAVRPEYADGAVAHLTREEEQYDPTDPLGRRTIDVLLEQAIVDLGTPQPAPHVNPEKR